MQYFTNRIEYISFLQKTFSQKNEISNLSKTKLAKSEMLNFIYKNDDYVYELEAIANRFALDPNLLELVLFNKDLPVAKLSSVVNKEFRFVNAHYDKTTKCIIVEGLIGSKYQYLFLNDKLINDSKLILDYIYTTNGGELHYIMNDKIASIYDIMKAFELASPNGLKRFKGLGEMNGIQLKTSTLDPDGDRTLIRYMLENAKEEIEEIRVIQSNKSRLLKEIGRVTRSELR